MKIQCNRCKVFKSADEVSDYRFKSDPQNHTHIYTVLCFDCRDEVIEFMNVNLSEYTIKAERT